MILSVHQPNFLPWIGFFNKIAKSDLFVILDSVQFPRGKSIANRNTIRQGNNKVELVVPIKKSNSVDGKMKYTETQFAENDWHNKIIKTIEMSYGKSLFFDKYFSTIVNLLNHESFCEMNIEFINLILKEYSINTEIVRLSEIDSSFGKKNDLIIDLCKFFGADTYLSGEGAKNYNIAESYIENEIKLEYNSYQVKEYNQIRKNNFISNLSILDLLFNKGKEGENIII